MLDNYNSKTIREVLTYVGFPDLQETVFEKHRGIQKIEIYKGYVQVSLSFSENEIHLKRIEVLKLITEAEISLDFLKFHSKGMAFVVHEKDIVVLESIVKEICSIFCQALNRCLVLIYAVNMRADEGLIPKILSIVATLGIPVDHLGDMHDKLLLVTSPADAEVLKKILNQLLESGLED